ncbi:MAG: thiaminase/transcriptional activator TenA [Haloarculaceae archaeon]|jgi:thiaminase/transcriptional activator TenA
MTDEHSSGGVPERYDAYAAGTAEPRFTDWLRKRAEPAWTAATDHQFTRELREDTLEDDVFRRYLIQDVAFLETLVGTVGHAVATAPTMAAKSRLSDFLGVLTDEETDYFERSFDALEVPEAERTDPTLGPTTRALEDLLVRGGREGGYVETLAVLVPAEWIYLSWASLHPDARLEPEARPERFYLAEWIDLHANPDFESFVGWLRSELDREGAEASQRRQTHLERLFRRTVDLEVAFFDSAYDQHQASGGEQSW